MGYVCCFINPMNYIVISTKNHRIHQVICTNLAIVNGGPHIVHLIPINHYPYINYHPRISLYGLHLITSHYLWLPISVTYISCLWLPMVTYPICSMVLVYLPTFAWTKSPSYVGKYTSTMVRIWDIHIYIYMYGFKIWLVVEPPTTLEIHLSP